MPTPLLTTKLHIPATRARLVPRPRLWQRLAETLPRDQVLILISAPAGFGKTTLLSDWIQHTSIPAAWLSLDPGDNDPARFLAYTIAALQTIYPDVAHDVVKALATTPRPKLEPLLTTVINDIGAAGCPGILILDDYHVIAAPAVHEAVTFLLDHLPLQLQLVIAGRTDPPLPLARWRGRRQLVEVRAADLSFTPAEAAAFLNEVMNLNLAAHDVAALAERTEGWIVGLQMAALSLQSCEDRSSFVRAFTGSHRFVLDYLIEEVLNRLPSEVQDFLLKTSTVAQLNASLCEALTDRADSQAVLIQLEQANLFLIPLDDERRWYRYHHLFADLLRARLLQTRPALPTELHRRASAWYAGHDLIAEAMHEAVQAGDIDRVARLAEADVLAMMDHGELSRLGGWIDAAPPEVMRARPWLIVAQAWVLSYTGQIAAVEPCLQAAEQAAGAAPIADARLTGHLAAIRSYVALLKGEADQAIELALDALQLLREKDALARSFALRVLGLTYRADGDLRDALKLLRESCVLSRAAGDSHQAMTALHDLSITQFVHGELPRAIATCQEGLQLAEEHRRRGGGQLPATGYLYALLGRLLCEQNDLDAAVHYAQTGVALSQQWELMEVVADCNLYLAQVLHGCGDLDGALAALEASRQAARRLSDWYAASLGPYEARLHLARGEYSAAERWAATQQPETDFGRNLYKTFCGLIVARVFQAQHRHAAALPVLEQVLHGSEVVHAIDHVIEALVLQALTFQALHRIEPALQALKRALSLAEPAGYVRLFIDEGAPLADLLRQAAARGYCLDYTSRLLSALQADQQRRAQAEHPTGEPLTDRELEVLRLVSIGQSNDAIAETLVISIETVKKHLKNIYGKLDVHSRMEAVNHAREAGLL